MGFQLDKSTIDSQISDLATQWRTLAEKSQHLLTQCLVTGDVRAYLIQVGYDNNPTDANPGGISDAQQAELFIDYMGGTLAGVYFGLVQQGGTGGTGAAEFNFNNALSPAWHGRI